MDTIRILIVFDPSTDQVLTATASVSASLAVRRSVKRRYSRYER
jgi:hypothetical protein